MKECYAQGVKKPNKSTRQLGPKEYKKKQKIARSNGIVNNNSLFFMHKNNLKSFAVGLWA
jgi:hypothetical protein